MAPWLQFLLENYANRKLRSLTSISIPSLQNIRLGLRKPGPKQLNSLRAAYSDLQAARLKAAGATKKMIASYRNKSIHVVQVQINTLDSIVNHIVKEEWDRHQHAVEPDVIRAAMRKSHKSNAAIERAWKDSV